MRERKGEILALTFEVCYNEHRNVIMPQSSTSSNPDLVPLFATGQPATLEMIRAFRLMGVHSHPLHHLDEQTIIDAFHALNPPTKAALKKMHHLIHAETIRAAEILIYLSNITLHKHEELLAKVTRQLKKFGRMEDL